MDTSNEKKLEQLGSFEISDQMLIFERRKRQPKLDQQESAFGF